MKRAIDITGQRFGKLVALERADVAIGKARWRCICDCGNTKIVFGTMLRNGHTTSCGCKRGKNQYSTPKVTTVQKPAWVGAEQAACELARLWPSALTQYGSSEQRHLRHCVTIHRLRGECLE